MASIIERESVAALRQAGTQFPAVVLTGPRCSGKTTLLRSVLPDAHYVPLEAPDVATRAASDPNGFLESLPLPVILDDIQNAPSLLPHVSSRVDARPERRGDWWIAGSQDFSLMGGAAESMAGRAAFLGLLPFSCRESGAVDLRRGAFPEVRLGDPAGDDTWFTSYIQACLERDVRSVTMVRNTATYRRFLAIMAVRAGQMLNRAEIASGVGVSLPTVSQWLWILKKTGLVFIVPPFFENFGKRLVRSPKLYWSDTGLLCHLLGLRTDDDLRSSPFLEQVFESFVASEVAKRQLFCGRRRELYYFRDQHGVKVDFVASTESGKWDLIEVRTGLAPLPATVRSLQKIRKAMGDFVSDICVVHRGLEQAETIAPGIREVGVGEFFGLGAVGYESR